MPAAVLAATLGLPAGNAWTATDPPPAAAGGDEAGLPGAPGEPDRPRQQDGSAEADVTGAAHDGAGDDHPPEDGSVSHVWTWDQMWELDRETGRPGDPSAESGTASASRPESGPAHQQAQTPESQSSESQPSAPQAQPAQPPAQSSDQQPQSQPAAPEPVAQQPSKPAQPESRPAQQDSQAAQGRTPNHRPAAEQPARTPSADVEPPREPERRPSARPRAPREHERRPAAKPRAPRKHERRPSSRPKTSRAVLDGGSASAIADAKSPANGRATEAKQKSGVLRSAARQVVRLINAKRTQAGCQPLRVSRRLSQAAGGHADTMAKSGILSHTAPDGSRPSTRAVRAGYDGWSAIGENIARGQASPAEVTQDWMNSPGHRANILNCSYEEVGVGVREGGPNGRYWAQSFGTRRS
ncbi:CAP domain-containing protein [Streptomyces sp. NPDC051776]|uniref:CAP domain-containing protein n=1 Tax=Streptomyces sp. NPDC051776 TaxID=3155414 RepID=UPI0034254CDC